MAFSILGTGTCYARVERESDGRLIATEWLLLLWIPVLPLRSLQVAEVESQTMLLLIVPIRQERALGVAGGVPLRRTLDKAYWDNLRNAGLLLAGIFGAFAGFALINNHTEGLATIGLLFGWMGLLFYAVLRRMNDKTVGPAVSLLILAVMHAGAMSLVWPVPHEVWRPALLGLVSGSFLLGVWGVLRSAPSREVSPFAAVADPPVLPAASQPATTKPAAVASVVITRPGADIFRQYSVILDGEETGRLEKGGKITVPLAEGRHALSVRATGQESWCGSDARGWRILPALVRFLVLPRSYLVLRRVDKI